MSLTLEDLNVILESSPIIFWKADLNGNFNYLSESWYKFTGSAIKDNLGSGWKSVVHPDDVTECVASFEEHFANKKPFELEYRFLRHDGKYRWVLDKGQPIYDDSGIFSGFVGYVTDITENKLAQENLTIERERLSDILRGTNSGTWEWNIETGETVFNQRWAEIIGYSLEELSPVSLDTWVEHCHPEDLERSNQLFDDIFKKKTDYYECEVRMRHKNGEWVWVLDRGKVTKWSDNGEPLIAMGTHIDITERKNAQTRIAKSENKYRELVENTTDIIYSLNSSGEFTYVSSAWKRQLGHEIHEVQGESFAKFVHSDDVEICAAALQNAFLTGESFTGVEYRVLHKNGTWRWHSSSGSAKKDNTGIIILFDGLAHDITQRKEDELKIAKQTEAQQLLISLASNFINVHLDEVSNSINYALEDLGRFFNVDRAYLFRYDWQQNTTSNTHEWCNNGIDSKKENSQNIPLKEISQWVKKHKDGEILHIPDTNAQGVDKALRETLHAQNIKSIITIPLILDNECIGFIGFDSVITKRAFTKAEEEMLTVFSHMLVNISKHQLVQEELVASKEKAEENERLLKKIAENFPNSYISVIEKDFTVGFTSGQEFTNQGINPTSFIGLSLKDVFGELADKVINEYNKSFDGKDNEFELEISNQIQLYRTVPFFNETGTVERILAVSENITSIRQREKELKKAKEAAEQNAKELKEAQKVASLASWYLDLATEEVTWSEELYKMYGFDPSLPPPPYTEQMKIFTPESWKQLTKELTKTREQGIPYELELNFVRADKSKGWMWVKGEAVCDSAKTIIGLRGVAQDITERKTLQLALQASTKATEENEKRLVVASNAAQLGIWEWDVKENILIWDERMYALYDYTSKKHTPNFDLWSARIHPEDKKQAIQDVNDALEGKREFDTTFRVIHQNGKELYIKGNATVLRSQNGEPIRMIGVNRDVSESRRKTRILETQNKQLIDFSNIIAHNLRAPLVNLQILIDYIESSEDEEKRKLFIDKQKTVLNHLNEVLNELMESIQIRQDKEIPSEKVSLKEHLEKTLKGLESQIHEYKASIKVDLNQADTITYPKKYIDSILSNLISNSIKYRSPERTPLIEVKTQKSNDDVILSVSDNGLGIDMSLAKKHIFKIRKVFHDHPDARGFGLFLIKTQVESMGGDIWVESTPNQGSTFFVKFINQ